MIIVSSSLGIHILNTLYLKRPVCLYVWIHDFNVILLCVPDARFYIGQQVTQSEDTTSATIRQDPASMKQMQKATAAKTAPTVLLHMDLMTCAALFMISGAKIT